MSSSPSAKKAKLDPAYKIVKQLSNKEQFFVLLGHMGSRYYHNVDNNLYELFNSLKVGINPMEKKIFSEEKSQHIKNSVGGGIGQRDWDMLRAELKPHIILTSRSKLQSYTIGNLFLLMYMWNLNFCSTTISCTFKSVTNSSPFENGTIFMHSLTF